MQVRTAPSQQHEKKKAKVFKRQEIVDYLLADTEKEERNWLPYKLIATFAYFGGLRATEIIHLNLEDVTVDDKGVTSCVSTANVIFARSGDCVTKPIPVTSMDLSGGCSSADTGRVPAIAAMITIVK